jgi:hypothetical protein
MEKQPDALRLAECLKEHDYCTFAQMDAAAAELRRLHAENELLMNALWKACGDDEEVVNATIESQR